MSTDIRYENGKLYVSRYYDAPREAVFDAWIETSKVSKWWGCDQTTNVEADIEPRVGGKFVHRMTINGVQQEASQGRLITFDPPAHLAFSDAEMTITVDFTEQGRGTQVVLVHEGVPEEYLQFVKPGWTAAFRKLDTFLMASVA